MFVELLVPKKNLMFLWFFFEIDTKVFMFLWFFLKSTQKFSYNFLKWIRYREHNSTWFFWNRHKSFHVLMIFWIDKVFIYFLKRIYDFLKTKSIVPIFCRFQKSYKNFVELLVPKNLSISKNHMKIILCSYDFWNQRKLLSTYFKKHFVDFKKGEMQKHNQPN